ncbi:MAG: FAD-dependent oxidoreductase [Candidatus Koribacter versatilis]|uniref:FAD-dependent oxidoreductase n=1 Tax=Candidatus Korobacter versatilis TaxID=658062 RepID=A0A932EPI1_9BACT|nr:FAD-dependent oxidoreductase [Candidatus Koribacter versatilis]
MSTPAKPTATVVGGGLAGLSAACALADSGFRVTLLERRPYLGGRASSYEHPGTNETVDNCQHVLLGCCTNLIDFYRRSKVEDQIRWYDELTFIEPGGRQSKIWGSGWPEPFHNAPSFLMAHSLSLRDKLGIARVMARLMPGLPDETNESFLAWLRRHGQTERAIERFWKVVLVSALNEDLDRMSIHYAAQVFRESFLKSWEAGRMGVPSVPLSELYGVAADYIRERGGEVKLRAAVETFRTAGDRVCVRSGGEEIISDYAILAVPFDVLAKMLPPEPPSEILLGALSKFEHSPITGIHFWFDRQVTDLEHAVLLDRTIQWMFHKSRLLAPRETGNRKPETGSYLELVVSSSKELVEKSKQEILDLALRELAEFFPAVKDAKVLKQTVIKEVHATYSAKPRSDDYRPPQRTEWRRVFLAGDWTATGWPATMEGAVRSGYRAAEELARAAGAPEKYLVPDLPAHGFMRWFKD